MNLKHPKLFLVTCAAVGLLSSAPSHAQTTLSGNHIVTGDLNVGTTGTTGNLLVTGDTGGLAPAGLKVTGDGGVVFTGSIGVGQIPIEGGGTYFMWYPKKAALRAGNVSDTGEWDDENIGTHSTALGTGYASGDYSVVLGWGFALGDRSAAMNGNAEGDDSFAASGGYAWGTYSSAMSWGNALGNDSFAASSGYAEGDSSTAINQGVTMGGYSFAVGGVAEGYFSIAAGYGTFSKAAYSFVVGRYNAVEGDSNDWIESEPLFVVGNGTGNSSDPPEVENRNALTVYKNGNISIPKRQGDIPMGEFGNPE